LIIPRPPLDQLICRAYRISQRPSSALSPLTEIAISGFYRESLRYVGLDQTLSDVDVSGG
jgi:hypothetical protein